MALDVDGDGFLDLVVSGAIGFGRNDGNGRIVGTRWAEESFSIQEYQDDYYDKKEVARIEANHYPEYPVWRWRPWRSGEVSLFSQLAYDASSDGSEDGVWGQIYFGGLELPVMSASNPASAPGPGPGQFSHFQLQV